MAPATRTLIVSADPPPCLAVSARLLHWAGVSRPGITHRMLYVATEGHEWTIGLVGLATSPRGGHFALRLDGYRQWFIWRSIYYAPLRSTVLIECPGDPVRHIAAHWVKNIVLMPGTLWRCQVCTQKEEGWKYAIFDIVAPYRWRPTGESLLTHPVLDLAPGSLYSSRVSANITRHRSQMGLEIANPARESF